MLFSLLFLAALLVAWFNGANDNFKGVATLYGSGVTGYRTALWWGTFTTFLGSVVSLIFARTLLVRFSGHGLVPEAILETPEFMIAVGMGAGLTVLLATFVGFPISTTHSLIGALAGTGMVAVGTQLELATLGGIYFLPLLASPLFAIGLGGCSSYFFVRPESTGKAAVEDSCVCVGRSGQAAEAPTGSGTATVTYYREGSMKTMAGNVEECDACFEGSKISVKKSRARDLLHFVSGGLVSFARGLNDTPKIVGLLLVAEVFNIQYAMLAIASAMAVGGLLHARKVAEVMSHKISGMNENEGITANLITSFLVIVASRFGLPVSTTHVSAGSIFGTGLITGKADTKVFSGVFASWVLTLPLSALLAGTIYLLV